MHHITSISAFFVSLSSCFSFDFFFSSSSSGWYYIAVHVLYIYTLLNEKMVLGHCVVYWFGRFLSIFRMLLLLLFPLLYFAPIKYKVHEKCRLFFPFRQSRTIHPRTTDPVAPYILPRQQHWTRRQKFLLLLLNSAFIFFIRMNVAYTHYKCHTIRAAIIFHSNHQLRGFEAMEWYVALSVDDGHFAFYPSCCCCRLACPLFFVHPLLWAHSLVNIWDNGIFQWIGNNIAQTQKAILARWLLYSSG